VNAMVIHGFVTEENHFGKSPKMHNIIANNLGLHKEVGTFCLCTCSLNSCRSATRNEVHKAPAAWDRLCKNPTANWIPIFPANASD
jgi:hypothetical protein